MTADTPLDTWCATSTTWSAALGIDGVGLGSDFDGATIPAEIGDVAGLPKLVEAFRAGGYDEETIRKICRDNWLSVLRRTWGG